MKNYQRKNLNGLIAGLNPAQSSGAVYSVTAVLPVLFSFVFLIFILATGLATGDYAESDWFLYSSFLLPQTAFFVIAFVFLRADRTGLETVTSKPHWKYFIVAVVLQIGLLSLSELNTWFIKFLGGIGYVENEIKIPSMDGMGFFGVLFVIAVLPAVFEELIFRGLLLKGLKNCGETFAVLICGALFALYHQKPEQTVYQFCCGAAFALVAIRSGSILPTVLSHFLNNAWILIMTKFSWSLASIYLPFLICSAICLVGSLAYLLFFDKKEGFRQFEKKKSIKDFLFFAGIGIFICLFSWISALFIGL